MGLLVCTFIFTKSVTERLIKMASEDYIKVMVDYGLVNKKSRSGVDTGKFENIYDSKVGLYLI